MNKAFRLLFWGYVFVFFRVHVYIDLLAAPIGYYMIYSGARIMSQQIHETKKVELVAFIGVLISVPGVFVNLSEVSSGGWMLYAEGLFVWKIIVVYYLFATWKTAIQQVGFARVRSRVQLTYMWYMGIHFLMLLVTAFSLNIGGDYWTILYSTVSVLVVLIDIALLILIASLRRIDWRAAKENVIHIPVD
ncbi:hypothetical protein DV702_14515 [Sporosarcina sp. PTS2304]|uniref:hypothetical protein n=1 Tax=Sporosarcina sp. PTS2304 TaxID=2283194 RepID=UPI000E0D41BE|nr:hypothetical protein [Sporosarcina sp. PTS2304]AXI00812.1 hypothetical protein DV702_14515 [Sporosarcina sp. PTS2304]